MVFRNPLGKIVIRGHKYCIISGVCLLALSACGKSGDEAVADPADAVLLETLAPPDRVDSAAKFVSRDGADIGFVVLTNGPGASLLMRADLKDLPEGWHGIHLHETGDCSDGAEGFLASGGHVDPDDYAHGLLNPDGPERADLPNIYAGADGRATAEFHNDRLALYPSEAAALDNGPFPLLDEDGFAIIVHAQADDHRTQPIGGAGERLACAAIVGGG